MCARRSRGLAPPLGSPSGCGSARTTARSLSQAAAPSSSVMYGPIAGPRAPARLRTRCWCAWTTRTPIASAPGSAAHASSRSRPTTRTANGSTPPRTLQATSGHSRRRSRTFPRRHGAGYPRHPEASCRPSALVADGGIDVLPRRETGVLRRNGIKTPVQQSYCGQNHHAGFRETAMNEHARGELSRRLRRVATAIAAIGVVAAATVQADPGEAMFLHDTLDGRTLLYARLATFDVTDLTLQGPDMPVA